MKRVILILTILIFLASILILGNCIYLYVKSSDNNNLSKNIKNINLKIDELNNEINLKKEELNKIKENNIDKVNLLEVWKKELQKTNS